MTQYLSGWGCRSVGFIHSRDGVSWEPWVSLGQIDQGHYQVSEVCGELFGTALNAHPAEGGLNCRTNLYYLQTPDLGKTWLTAAGQRITVPVTDWDNPALVHDFRAEGRLVYVRDMVFDPAGRPVVLIVTSKNFRPGPAGAPRFWQLACWTGSAWDIRTICPADCNYDMGSLYFEPDGTWKLIAPTEPGPQPGNPGGEIACWTSSDEGRTWKRQGMLTSDSEYSHTFVRRPINAADGFYAFWADGHARQPSPSRLYFCDKAGTVYRLPAMAPGSGPPSVL